MQLLANELAPLSCTTPGVCQQAEILITVLTFGIQSYKNSLTWAFSVLNSSQLIDCMFPELV